MIDNTALLSELYSIQESYSIEPAAIDQTDKRCIIDVKERTINIPIEIESLGVQYDHRSYKLLFEIDRYVYGVDLLTQTCVIQWLSKNGTAERSGLHPVVEIEAIDNDKLLFVWELYEDETRIPGTILFAVNFYTMKDENSFLWSYNTLPASSTIQDTLDVVINPSDEITPSLLMVWNDKMTSIERLAHDSVSTSIKSAQEAEAWAHGRADFPNTMLDNAKYYKDLTQALYDEAKDVLSEEKDKVVEEAKAEIIDLAKDEVIAVAKEEVTNDVINDVYTVKNESITAINDTTTSAIQEVEQSRNNAINDLLSTGDQRYAVKGSIPTKVSELENDSKYLTEVPEAPVKSVNSKTGEVKLSAEDIGAVASEEFAEFKIDYDNHSHTAEEIGAATSEEVIQLKDDLGALDEKVKNLPTDDPGDVSWNDLTDRPFYEEIEYNELFNGTIHFGDMAGEKSESKDLEGLVLVAGKSYIIHFGGEEFRLEAKIYKESNISITYIGNQVYLEDLGLDNVEDTGEPFIIFNVLGKTIIASGDGDFDADISISEVKTNVHQIHPKYLPIMKKTGSSGGEVIFPETTSVDVNEFESEEDVFTSGVTFIHMVEEFDEGVECYGLILNPLRFEEGVEYTINWNGTSYKCTPIFAADGSTGDGAINTLVVLGNASLSSGVGDTGEPFVMLCEEYDMTNGGMFEMLIIDSITPVTLSITKGSTEEKYLIDPKHIPNMYYEEECKGEIFPLTKAVTEDQMTESDTLMYAPSDGLFRIMQSVILDIVEGETYIVSLNGEEYSCKATIAESEPGSGVYGTVLGDIYTATSGMNGTAPTGEPFAILVLPPEMIELYGASATGILIMEPPAELTLAISSSDGKIHKIPEKYLPDGFGGASSWNDLTDKPFYEVNVHETLFPTQNVHLTNDISYSYENLEYIPLVVGRTYAVSFDGEVYNLTAKRIKYDGTSIIYVGNNIFLVSAANAFGDAEGIENTGEPFCLICSKDMSAILSSRINEDNGQGKEVIFGVDLRENSIKQLDSKYIKDMYYEATEDVVVFEVFDSIEGEIVGIVKDCYKTTFLNTVFKLVEGETYTITINGFSFESTCYKEQEASGLVVMAIGNSSLADVSSWDVRPTSDPFLLRSLTSTTDDTVGEVYLHITRDFRDSISIPSCPIVVTRKEEVVHPIKSKYLPMDEITSAVIAALPKYEGEVTEV